jgi:anti-sigma B factor antagonist
MTLEEAVEMADSGAGAMSGRLTTLSPFEISVLTTPAGRTMVLAGELDISTAPALRDRMAEVADEFGAEFVLDIAGLTFIDSTGLSLIVSEHKKLKASGAELVVQSPTRTAQRLFEISGLDAVLTLRPGAS